MSECNAHSKGKSSFCEIFVSAKNMHVYEYMYWSMIKMYFLLWITVKKSRKRKKKKTLIESWTPVYIMKKGSFGSAF